MTLFYLGGMYGPLSAIAHTTGQLQAAIAGARRVRAMFALTPETVDAPGAVDASNVTGDIRFENVGFDYPDGTKVLHDIDFTAKPGEMVALVGLTGKKGEHVDLKVTAKKGKELYFMCILHPWMQGKILVK